MCYCNDLGVKQCGCAVSFKSPKFIEQGEGSPTHMSKHQSSAHCTDAHHAKVLMEFHWPYWELFPINAHKSVASTGVPPERKGNHCEP